MLGEYEMSRQPWIVAMLTTLVVGGTATSADAVTGSGKATQAVSTLAVVSPAPMAAAVDSAGNLNVIRTRGDGVILRDQKGASGRFMGWQASSGPALVAVAAESDTFVAVEAGLDAQGNVYVSRQVSAGSAQWTGWQVLNDLLLTSVALARNADGRLELIGTNFDGSVIRRTQNAVGSVDPATGWGQWRMLDGPPMQSVAAETNFDGRITMVGIGRAGDLAGMPFFRTQMAVNNTNWWEWRSLSGRQLPPGARLHSIAVARANDDMLKVFGVENGGRLLVLRETSVDGPQWDPSWGIMNDGHGDTIAAQGDVNQSIHLFGSDGAGTTSFRVGHPTDVYSSWHPMNQYAPVLDVKPTRLTALVMMVEWQGHTHGPNSRGISEVAQMVNSDHWWPEVSYGHFADFTVGTVGQMVIIPTPPAALTPCSPEFFQAISIPADLLAASRGRNPFLYNKVVYYLPHLGCPTTEGQVDRVGGQKAYILANPNKAQDRLTILHELGHLLGLHHADGRGCHVPGHPDQPVTLSTECTPVEYAAPMSVMGDGRAGTLAGFAASQRALLGWLTGRTIDVRPSRGIQSVNLSPIELTTVEPGRSIVQAIRITDNGMTLWVELRQPVGVDTDDVPFPGVYIYQELGGDAHSYLLDMTPGSLPAVFDYVDAGLLPGRTWVNPLGDLAITVQSVDSASAAIRITMR